MPVLRLDYSWTETILGFWAALTLAVMAVTSLVLRYVTTPLTCYCPAQLPAFQVQYMHQACFHSTQIYLQPNEDEVVPSDPSPSTNYTYHQWLPFFLGVASLLCLLPHVVWRALNCLLWLDVHELAQTVRDNQRQDAAGRHVTLRDYALLLQAGLKGSNLVLTLTSLGRKVLVVAVCVIQFLMMALVFSPRLSAGSEGDGSGSGRGSNSSIALPLEPFMCSVTVMQMAREYKYSFLCYMPLAQVYSKGLAFLFYFFFILFLLSALDLVMWAGRLLLPVLKDLALQRYLAVLDQSENDTQGSSHTHFLQSLGPDGRLILAVTADGCGSLAASDLTKHLLKVFKDSPRPSPYVPKSSDSAPTESDPVVLGPEDAETGSGSGLVSVPLVTVSSEQDGDGVTVEKEEEKPC